MTGIAQPARTIPIAEPDPIQREDHFVHLDGASWGDYERILALRGDHTAPRITYDNGVLQIMSPSRSHEAIKSLIGRLVEAYCLERGIEFDIYGSWTLKNRNALKGLEPDECYVFGEVQDPDTPDLAIEVIWTSGGIDKLHIYEALGIREVWVWKSNQITVYTLSPTGYQPSDKSTVLTEIDLAALTSCMEANTTSAAIKAFRSMCKPQR